MIVRHTSVICALASLALACSSKKAKPDQVVQADSTAEATPAPTMAISQPPLIAPAAASSKPQLHLLLRSTPSGATAAVDGQVRGQTPISIDVDQDNREHEFTFVLRDYAMARYRFVPIKDGAVWATLQRLDEDTDAGPSLP